MASISSVKKLSSGNPFLDHLLSGGFALSTIVLFIEDSPTKLYQSFLKYSIAQGVTDDNKVFFYHFNRMIYDAVIEALPYQSTQVDAILNSKTKEASTANSNNEMKIAWRYENINYDIETSNITIEELEDLLVGIIE